MKIVNMHEAKANLSKLVAAAEKGEALVIARDGKPLVNVEPIAPKGSRRLGFLIGKGVVPDDFDRIETENVAAAFGR